MWVTWINKIRNVGLERLIWTEYIYVDTNKKILQTIAYIEKRKFIKERQT